MQGDKHFKMLRCLFLTSSALLLNKLILLETFENVLLSEENHLGLKLGYAFDLSELLFLEKTASQDAGWSHCINVVKMH